MDLAIERQTAAGRHQYLVRLVLLTMAGGCGCSEPLAPEWTPIDARPYAVGRAAANLSPDGLFQYADVMGEADLVSFAEARGLAVAWLRTFAWPDIVPAGFMAIGALIEKQHGRSIDWHSLKPAIRVMTAHTPYERIGDSTAVRLRSLLGPFLMVMVTGGGVPIALIGVSAYNTEHDVRPDGRLHRPDNIPNAYSYAGIQIHSLLQYPMQPEYAAKVVFDATGARVSEVPELTRPGRRYAPELSYWRAVLERAVGFVTEAGTRVNTDTVYVTAFGGFAIAMGELDDAIPYTYTGPDSLRVHAVYEPVLRPGASTSYAPVRVAGTTR